MQLQLLRGQTLTISLTPGRSSAPHALRRVSWTCSPRWILLQGGLQPVSLQRRRRCLPVYSVCMTSSTIQCCQCICTQIELATAMHTCMTECDELSWLGYSVNPMPWPSIDNPCNVIQSLTYLESLDSSWAFCQSIDLSHQALQVSVCQRQGGIRPCCRSLWK